MRGAYKKEKDQLFIRSNSDRISGNGIKLKEDVRRKFFTPRVVRHRNSLPREVVDVPSLEAFKAMQDMILGSLI